MIDTTLTESPRGRLGGASLRLWGNIFPTTHKNGGYRLGKSEGILYGKFTVKKTGPVVDRNKLYKHLLSLGFSKMMSGVISSRSYRTLKRMNTLWDGVVTSLILTDVSFFYEENHLNLKNLYREVTKWSAFNMRHCVRMWKEFTLRFRNVHLEYDIITGNLPNENVFKRIEKWENFQTFIQNKVLDRKVFLERTSHLLSTRQMPAGDEITSQESYKTFCENVTSGDPINSETEAEIEETAFQVGRRTKKFMKNFHVNFSSHISLSAAGTIGNTVKDGGRGKDVRDACFPILNQIMESDGEIECSLGKFPYIAGHRLYQSLARDKILYEGKTPEIGEIYEDGGALPSVSYRNGLDDAIGMQILIIAFIEYDKKRGYPIMANVIMINEPGMKSRTVTTTEWWTVLIQQAPSHIIQEMLRCHPSAFAGLSKAEQTWQFQCNAAGKNYPADYTCLSSDMKAATDNIPHTTARALVNGFWRGAFGRKPPPIVSAALEIVTSPHSIFCDYGCEIIISNRGVFMGEPMTKSILTLLALVAEEHAFARSRIPDHLRTFAVGGDDHTAIGPVSYLRGITSFIQRMGAKISPDKHGMSQYAVTYCEKIIWVEAMLRGFKVKNRLTGDEFNEWYKTIPYVDSIKVRLISTETKPTFSVNDRNTAIGKGKAIASIMRGITGQTDNGTIKPTREKGMFSHTWFRLVRDLFYVRMGPMLPKRETGLYFQSLLPESLGGLGLLMESDINNICRKIPYPSKRVISEAAIFTGSEFELPPIIRDIRKFLKNGSFRGYDLDTTMLNALEGITQMLKYMAKGPFTFEECIENHDLVKPGVSSRMMFAKLYRKDIMPLDQAVERILRCTFNGNVLSDSAVKRHFKSQDLKERYSQFWKVYYDGPRNISEADLRKAIETNDKVKFYDFSNKYFFQEDTTGRTYLTSAIDQFSIGSPGLILGWEFLTRGKIPLEKEYSIEDQIQSFDSG